jgi:hypothetical protein
MLTQLITTIGFTAWALALYALLPKAFRLHLKQNSSRTKALKQPVRLTWKPGAWATAGLLILILVRLSEN